MGLLDKLFGKKKDDGGRAALLDAVRSATAQPMKCGGCLSRLMEALPPDAGAEAKLDAINALFEMDRNDWAEALAVHLAHESDCPLGILKGLARHFIETGQSDRVLDPVARLLRERPSETELAVLHGRSLLRAKEDERILVDLRPPFDNAPDSRHLYGILGQAAWRLGRGRDALTFVRTACELYEQAFRLRQVLPDDMNTEQLDYAYLHGLVGEIARDQLGPTGEQEVYESLTLDPSSFGMVHEAEELAASRIDYKPPRLELESIEELDARIAALGDGLGEDALASLLRGERAFREGDLEEALARFRETLELDLECYAAYYGWAACDALLRREPQEPPKWSAPAELDRVLPDHAKMTAHERVVVARAAERLGSAIPRMATAGTEVRVHPLDVRLKDLYPERTEMRFDLAGRSPQAVALFAPKKRAHVRLDAFLLAQPGSFPLARALGYALADAILEEKGPDAEEARRIATGVKAKIPQGTLSAGWGADEMIADAFEALCANEGVLESAGERGAIYAEAGLGAFLERLTGKG